jgi:ABC-type uncharacterized transport system substrate-binding protein
MESQKQFIVPVDSDEATGKIPSSGRGRAGYGLKQRARYRTRCALLALLFVLVNADLQAAPDSILILKSGPEKVYSVVTESLTARLREICSRRSSKCSPPLIDTVALNGSEKKEAERLLRDPWKLIITVGGKAAALVSENDPSAPVLYTVLPRKSFEHLRKKSGSKNISAIFIDQPLARKFALIKESMPERKRVGILISKANAGRSKTFRRLASRFGLSVEIAVVEDERQIGNTLRDLLKKSDVLLALPDPAIFNQRTVKSILLSSYHNRIPVVGFSAAYVKAGAIVAVYSSPEEIGRHIGDWVGSLLKRNSNILSAPAYPKYFSIGTNNNVADSLQIRLPAARDLENSLEEKGL